MTFKFNWVLVNELAISSAPFQKSNLDLIHKKGIKSVLTLCSEKEALLPKNISFDFIHKRFFLPDHSYKEEMKIKDIKKILDILGELKNLGPVLVHCLAGVERSPLVCIAWLMTKNGTDLETSLRYLMRVNPGTNPLPKQLLLLKELNKNQLSN